MDELKDLRRWGAVVHHLLLSRLCSILSTVWVAIHPPGLTVSPTPEAPAK
jgi:hypothetical protein